MSGIAGPPGKDFRPQQSVAVGCVSESTECDVEAIVIHGLLRAAP
jgi:hypothetical protein